MRELLRVTKENQDILKRITQRKPEYDHQKWQRDWEGKQKFMNNIASYPPEWWKNGEKVSKASTLYWLQQYKLYLKKNPTCQYWGGGIF